MVQLAHFAATVALIARVWLGTLLGVLGAPVIPDAPINNYLPLIATQATITETTNSTAPVQASESFVTKPTIGIWLNASELAALPMTGVAWNAVKAAADQATGTPSLSDQESTVNTRVLAKALVYARTGQPNYRNDVVAALQIITFNNTENGGRTLALGRELTAYIIAADLIDLATYDPALNTQFKTKLRELLTKTLDGLTLRSTQENRANNWGLHAGATRAAIAIYLGDTAELARTATVFRGWLGDRSAYQGFSFGELDWQADPTKPVGINPLGAMKAGHSIDGALPDEMRRGGPFQWPPEQTNYPWGALQGALVEAEILDRAGYPAWEWQNRALLRAVQFLYSIGWSATGDDVWQIWLINHTYGTTYAATAKASPGKNMGWTSWTHASTAPPPSNQAPIVNAGTDASISLSAQGILDGAASDDGLPNGNLTTTWSKVSGPGEVLFGDADAVDTTATFSQAGVYVLRLTANDGARTSSDDVQITVNTPAPTNQPPVVNAGADTSITLPAQLTLDGAVSDDGLPNDSLTTTWSRVSGPGEVLFGDASAVDTTVSFSVAGVYLLRLTATDGALTTGDEIQVMVSAMPTTNQAPQVNAGNDSIITLPAGVTLDGSVSDDGQPSNNLTIAWSKISGPGDVAFEHPNAVDTNATFSQAGVYMLRLTASDGEMSTSDEVQITATQAAATLNFTPIADAYVDSAKATRNYGTVKTLRIRTTSSAMRTYLQFQVSGVSGSVQSAKLRLYVTDASDQGGSFYLVANTVAGSATPWTEKGLIWNNAPAINGAPLATLGAIKTKRWVELDVTAAVRGNGLYSFGILTTSSNNAIYSSREGANKPLLVVTTGVGAVSGATAGDSGVEQPAPLVLESNPLAESSTEDVIEETPEETSEETTDEGEVVMRLFLPLIEKP